jgi:hypothetical protein
MMVSLLGSDKTSAEELKKIRNLLNNMEL